MDNKRYFSFELDFAQIGESPKRIGKVKQLDGTQLEIFILNDSLSFDLSACAKAKLYAKKPNEKFVYQEADIVLDELLGAIKIECKNSIFSAPGLVVLECELFDMDGYVITTPSFSIEVIEKISALEDIVLEEANEIQPLEKMYAYVKERQKTIDEFIDVLEILGGHTEILENICVLKEMMESNLQ